LRDAIQKWRKRNPDQIFVEFVRFGDFADTLGESALAKAQQSGGFLGISGAKRSVDEALLLAERAMFYVQKVPAIARFQAKLLVYDLTEQPQMRQLVSDTNTLAQAMSQMAQTTEQLPAQTEATIDQLTKAIKTERSEAIDHFMAQVGTLADDLFGRAVVLILIFLVGGVLAMLTYRYAAERLFGSSQARGAS
jgi:hypothetical protein